MWDIFCLAKNINYKKKKIHKLLITRMKGPHVYLMPCTTNLPWQLPVNRLNGYLILTALGFASGVTSLGIFAFLGSSTFFFLRSHS